MAKASGLVVKFERELARIPLANEEALVVRAVEYEKGGLRLDLRKFYTAENDELRPTGKGVSLKPEWFPEIRAALSAFEGIER